MEEIAPFPLSQEPATEPALPPGAPQEVAPAEVAPVMQYEPQPPRPLIRTQTLPLAVAYTGCPTVGEYLEQQAPPGSPLRLRLREVRLTSEAQCAMAEFPETLHLLALAPEGLPDNVGVVPLWIRMAESCPRAELRFAGEFEFPHAERLLGDDPSLQIDALELPHLILFDEEWRPVAHWGPRPSAADPLLDEWLAQHPDFELLFEGISAELRGDPVDAAAHAANGQPLQQAFGALNQQLMLQMRIWYNSGLDAEASNELQALLAGLRDETESTDARA